MIGFFRSPISRAWADPAPEAAWPDSGRPRSVPSSIRLGGRLQLPSLARNGVARPKSNRSLDGPGTAPSSNSQRASTPPWAGSARRLSDVKRPVRPPGSELPPRSRVPAGAECGRASPCRPGTGSTQLFPAPLLQRRPLQGCPSSPNGALGGRLLEATVRSSTLARAVRTGMADGLAR